MNVLVLTLVLAAGPQDTLADRMTSAADVQLKMAAAADAQLKKKKGPCSPACACGCQEGEPCDCVRGTEKRKVAPVPVRRAVFPLFRGRTTRSGGGC